MEESFKNEKNRISNSLFSLSHPELAMLALPLSTRREGRCPLADVG